MSAHVFEGVIVKQRNCLILALYNAEKKKKAPKETDKETDVVIMHRVGEALSL